MSKAEVIAELINDGLTAREINYIVGGHIQNVYGVARRYGLSIARSDAYISDCQPYDKEIKTLRAKGLTYREIADAIGVGIGSVRNYCQKHEIKMPKEYTAQCHGAYTEKQVAKKVNEITEGKLRYISGYTNWRSQILIECAECGTQFERGASRILQFNSAKCPHCEDIKAQELERIKQEQEKAERERKAEAKAKRAEAQAKEREKERERKRKEREHRCPVCGTITDRKKYCSDKCRRKADNKRRETKRRLKIEAVAVDKDITVKGLFKRDNGICHICGRKCNAEDYVMRDGVFITGDWYPSIDHITPLAKGGAHSWNNVALAHRRCNYLKGDK